MAPGACRSNDVGLAAHRCRLFQAFQRRLRPSHGRPVPAPRRRGALERGPARRGNDRAVRRGRVRNPASPDRSRARIRPRAASLQTRRRNIELAARTFQRRAIRDHQHRRCQYFDGASNQSARRGANCPD